MLQVLNVIFKFTAITTTFFLLKKINKVYYISTAHTLFQITQLKGELHPYLKLAYFMCYLKIINTFMKNNVMHLKANYQRNSKLAMKF